VPVLELAQSAPQEVFERLGDKRLLIVSGKGGVGRTTVAALTGLILSQTGRRVLVATTGHDDRLAWMLGVERLGAAPREVLPGLSILRLEPDACVREYGSLVLRSRRLSKAVFGNRLVRRFYDAIPGADDFAVLGKVWHEATRAGRYDVVVFDGPATGHLRLALGVPRAIVDTVFEGPLAREAEEIKRSLEDPAVASALLVAVPERWPLTELGELAQGLHYDIGLSVDALVINKLWRAELPELDPTRIEDGAVREVFEFVEASRHRSCRQEDAISEWISTLRAPGARAPWLTRGLIELPWRATGVESREDLTDLVAVAQHRSLTRAGPSLR
jgi:anion-transporting  ArsA/GET3 family ATPase